MDDIELVPLPATAGARVFAPSGRVDPATIIDTQEWRRPESMEIVIWVVFGALLLAAGFLGFVYTRDKQRRARGGKPTNGE
jgi:hypothetical protein